MRELRRGQPRRCRALPRLQHLADVDHAADTEHPALIRAAAVVAIAAAVAVAILAVAPTVLGDDASAPPATGAPLTCADRFPGEGPAGVDLQLGCIVSVVVGAYVPSQASPPPPLSSYAITVGAIVLALAAVAWLAIRVLTRRAGRRLAPVLPDAWWVCAACRSVNGAGAAHCYRCGAGPPDGPTLTTDASPGTPQSFGTRRKSG